MNKKYCKEYCGIACVDGHCPNALPDEYPEYDIYHVNCRDCIYYKGCKNCLWKHTEFCISEKEKNNER